MKVKFQKMASLLFALCAVLAAGYGKELDSGEVPSGIKEYEITVNGKPVKCNYTYVYDERAPEKTLTLDRGYGTPARNTIAVSTVGYCNFDFEGSAQVEVKVKNLNKVTSATIRPLSKNIVPTIDGTVVKFRVTSPAQLTLEVNGSESRALHIFADNPDKNKPDPNAANVRYFGKGTHELRASAMRTGETLYLDNEAHVYLVPAVGDTGTTATAMIRGTNISNITIAGRGILDFSRYPDKDFERRSSVRFDRCSNVTVQGVTLIGSPLWNLQFRECSNLTIDNAKIISYFYNSDGIDICTCKDVVVKNCFLRQRDDAICVKAFRGTVQRKAQNIVVENCTIWSDWGYALGVTYEVQDPAENIEFRNCDIIHATTKGQGVIGVLLSDYGDVTDVRFKNITIERSLKPLILLSQMISNWTTGSELGTIKNVSFSNIRYLSGARQPVRLNAVQGTASIDNITFEGLVFLGSPINSVTDWDFNLNDKVGSEIYLNGKKLFAP